MAPKIAANFTFSSFRSEFGREASTATLSNALLLSFVDFAGAPSTQTAPATMDQSQGRVSTSYYVPHEQHSAVHYQDEPKMEDMTNGGPGAGASCTEMAPTKMEYSMSNEPSEHSPGLQYHVHGMANGSGWCKSISL